MDEDKKINKAAQVLSKLGASKGGIARATKLTAEERSEIARNAVQTRWDKTKNINNHNLPKATHQGILKIGDKEIPCAVLDDGTRVISRNAIFKAFGRTKRGRKKGEVRVLNMPSFIDANNLQPFIDNVLPGGLKTIEYQPTSGRPMEAYDAKMLPLLCDVYLSARQAIALTKSQLPLASVAEMLVRSFSKIGIVALVDEATGFQYDRQRDELEKLLAVYLSEEKLKWAKTFPDEFYKQIYRLKAWQYPGTGTKRSPFIGKITNEIVYDKLPPGVLPKLRELNPKIENTHRRRWKLFQFLSEDIGQPDLRDHLLQLIAIMRASRNWKSFEKLLERAFPSRNPKPIQGEIWPEDEDEE